MMIVTYPALLVCLSPLSLQACTTVSLPKARDIHTRPNPPLLSAPSYHLNDTDLKMSHDTMSSLITLPAELRNMIYHNVFPDLYNLAKVIILHREISRTGQKNQPTYSGDDWDCSRSGEGMRFKALSQSRLSSLVPVELTSQTLHIERCFGQGVAPALPCPISLPVLSSSSFKT